MGKIVFVRYRSFYKDVPPMLDVLYNSGRCVSMGKEEAPETVKRFIKSGFCKYEYDKVFGHTFTYYER